MKHRRSKKEMKRDYEAHYHSMDEPRRSTRRKNMK